MASSLMNHYFSKLKFITILSRRKTEQLLQSAFCLPSNTKHQVLYAERCLKLSFQIRFSSKKQKEYRQKIAPQGKLLVSDLCEAVNQKVTQV